MINLYLRILFGNICLSNPHALKFSTIWILVKQLTLVDIAEVGDVWKLLEHWQVKLAGLEEGCGLPDVDGLDPVTGQGVEHIDVSVTVHLLTKNWLLFFDLWGHLLSFSGEHKVPN